MELVPNNTGWENIPTIRLIAFKYLELGPDFFFNWRQNNVRGPYWRIYWNSTPGAFITCNGREVELTPDKIIVIAPNAVYSTRAENKFQHFYIHCFISNPFSEIHGQMFVFETPELIALASAIAQRVNQQVDIMRTQMMLLVYINSILLQLPHDCIPERTKYDARVAKAIEILSSTRNISNQALAQKAGMSTNGFLLLFKKETNVSPQAYSRQIRLNEACIMLQHSEKTIEEIAQLTGFCDRYHFSREFRKVIGYTPHQFRMQKSHS
jgi:AraC-like DNA-binding protein